MLSHHWMSIIINLMLFYNLARKSSLTFTPFVWQTSFRIILIFLLIAISICIIPAGMDVSHCNNKVNSLPKVTPS